MTRKCTLCKQVLDPKKTISVIEDNHDLKYFKCSYCEKEKVKNKENKEKELHTKDGQFYIHNDKGGFMCYGKKSYVICYDCSVFNNTVFQGTSVYKV